MPSSITEVAMQMLAEAQTRYPKDTQFYWIGHDSVKAQWMHESIVRKTVLVPQDPEARAAVFEEMARRPFTIAGIPLFVHLSETVGSLRLVAVVGEKEISIHEGLRR